MCWHWIILSFSLCCAYIHFTTLTMLRLSPHIHPPTPLTICGANAKVIVIVMSHCRRRRRRQKRWLQQNAKRRFFVSSIGGGGGGGGRGFCVTPYTEHLAKRAISQLQLCIHPQHCCSAATSPNKLFINALYTTQPPTTIPAEEEEEEKVNEEEMGPLQHTQ